MATAAVTNNFTNGTPADAEQVDTNFADLVSFLNNSVIHKDGSKAMTASFDAGSQKIINLSTGTAGTDAVNKTQMDAAIAALVADVDTDYVSYSPALTNITIGNGTQTHKWRYLGGKTVLVSNTITFGSTTSFTGWPQIATPVTMDNTIMVFGGMQAVDNSPSNNYGGIPTLGSTTVVGGVFLGTNGLFTFVSATVPFTWTTGDIYRQVYIGQTA